MSVGNVKHATLFAGMIATLGASTQASVVVPLSNLFDDAPGAAITDAIATDSYNTAAGSGSLGVDRVLQASSNPLNVGQFITPTLQFNFNSIDAGSTSARPVLNDVWGDSNQPIRTTGDGTGYDPNGGKIEDGIGMHASAAITFDLNEIRHAGAPSGFSMFRAYFDQNDDQPNNGSFRGAVIVSDDAGNILGAYVNGQRQAVASTGGVYEFTGTIPGEIQGSGTGVNFDVGISREARYLTLAAVSSNITADHSVWSGARTEFEARPTIALGNLFDDGSASSLWTALDTDTYRASADANDLGVDSTQSGGFDQVVSLTSAGVQFDFTNVGGGSAGSNGLANDAIGTSNRPPLRTTGSEAPALSVNDPKIEDGIGIHANGLITFDLDEIRAAGGLQGESLRFLSEAGLNDSSIGAGSVRVFALVSDASGVLAGYINGQEVALENDGGIWSFNGIIPDELGPDSPDYTHLFDIVLGTDAQFLTLAVTGGDNITSDHGVFSDARLELTVVPEPAVLGALALGSLLLVRKR